ncbi:unnamed protein product, partial [Lampetra fluviatilis]
RLRCLCYLCLSTLRLVHDLSYFLRVSVPDRLRCLCYLCLSTLRLVHDLSYFLRVSVPDRLRCLCDLWVDACDPNCCCDAFCSEGEKAAFTECLPGHRVCVHSSSSGGGGGIISHQH